MSHRRFTKLELCPLDDLGVTMDKCGNCRFYRGAASSHHELPGDGCVRADGLPFQFRHGWDVNCNWPRDGAYLAVPGDGHEHPGTEKAVGGGRIPQVFQDWERDDD